MPLPNLYRKRFIPEELTLLKDDIILQNDKDLIITKWVTLHPRKDIACGISAFYIDKGYKVSKIYNSKGKLVYWYCDIIHTEYDPENNSIIFEDLLVDVVIYEDGTQRVLDLDELAEAFDLHLINETKVKDALKALDSLLRIIYTGDFGILMDSINKAELLYSSSNI